mmetsp:Transcript_21294/g.52432  ORF Transcript_21294/g.52432 Transcript_21294/m.52432 type:complete len:120 (+) Transcript_21294:296-655(+)
MLLPAASRLTALRIHGHDADDDIFSELLRTASNLKFLKIEDSFGDCGRLLCAISSLPNLETLLMSDSSDVDSPGLQLNSEDSLLALAAGPVRRSLVTCRIVLGSYDTKLTGSLFRCFYN